jgi:hypothetical protein
MSALIARGYFLLSNINRVKMNEQLLSRKEAARYLNVSVSSIIRFEKLGKIKVTYRIGDRPRYTKTDLEAVIKKTSL